MFGAGAGVGAGADSAGIGDGGGVDGMGFVMVGHRQVSGPLEYGLLKRGFCCSVWFSSGFSCSDGSGCGGWFCEGCRWCPE